MPARPQNDPSVDILVCVIGAFLVGVGISLWIYRRAGGRLLGEAKSQAPVPWGPITVCAVLLLFYGINLIGFASADGKVIPLREMLLRLAAVNVVFVVMIPPLLRASSGAKLADLGLSTDKIGRQCLLGAASCALALPLVYGVQMVAVALWKPTEHPVQQAFAADPSWPTALVAGFGAIVCAPAAEEILFRGILLATCWKVGASLGTERKSSAELVSNFAISMLFGGMHAGQWPAPLSLFVLSMCLGELYRRSGSMIATIVMHACFNGLSMSTLLIASALGRLPVPG
jgi:membrane protease YdiL (CAAX protease family)